MRSVLIEKVDVFHDFRGSNYFPFDKVRAERLRFHVQQINQSFSVASWTIRGIHYQTQPYEQAKLVQCLTGSIFNVAVDIRQDSPTFGQYKAEILSKENHKMMYIPRGFAHGFLTLEPNTLVQWCVDNDFCKEAAKCIRWDSCGIEWPGKKEEYIISDKDKNGVDIRELE